MIDFRPIAQEMARNAPDEVNFIHEGRAAEMLAETLAGRDDIVIPKIYWERSTRRVLTMDYLDGIKITDVTALRAAGVDTGQVADTLIDLFNTMILKHGAFHADPHPGNLFVLPAKVPGGRAKIGLVDFGLTKRIPDEFRMQLIVLTSAIIASRPQDVYDSMSEMGFRTRDENVETYNALGEAFLGDVLRSGQAYADQANPVAYSALTFPAALTGAAATHCPSAPLTRAASSIEPRVSTYLPSSAALSPGKLWKAFLPAIKS